MLALGYYLFLSKEQKGLRKKKFTLLTSKSSTSTLSRDKMLFRKSIKKESSLEKTAGVGFWFPSQLVKDTTSATSLIILFESGGRVYNCIQDSKISPVAMTRNLLLWVLTDTTAALSVFTLQNPVWVYPGQVAVLPISLQFANSAWEFYHVKWEFVTGNRPILVYMVDSCTRLRESQERTCQHSMDLAELYHQRATLSFHNASLVLQGVQPKDAGVYRVTVRGLDVSAVATVNLTVMEDLSRRAKGNGNCLVPNSTPLGVVFLAFCLLEWFWRESINLPCRSPFQCTSKNG
ncbi:uncharacterized protein LOC106732829 isoform X2 [Pelodiscus sinensis]|uniref:uncharacterized protein LOC106732829 isoform X2 n=1 Tax=Pelodiscus sinensis TaxID=13735 RepID=UPI003F6AC2D0